MDMDKFDSGFPTCGTKDWRFSMEYAALKVATS